MKSIFLRIGIIAIVIGALSTILCIFIPDLNHYLLWALIVSVIGFIFFGLGRFKFLDKN
jgi:hypothetical protein